MSERQANYLAVSSTVFSWFFDIKIISKIITKAEEEIHLYIKIKGTSFLIKNSKFKQNLKKKLNLPSDIHNLSHIHQVSLKELRNYKP